MTDVDIRALTHEDDLLRHFVMLPNYAFSATPPLRTPDDARNLLATFPARTVHVLFEDNRPLAAAVSQHMTQHVRGKRYPMGGVGPVATDPAGRRKGYARQVIAHLLQAVRDEGRVFTTLYPFRESFYQRLGYITFPMKKRVILQPEALAPLLKMDLGGSVDYMPLFDGDTMTGFEIYRDYLKQMLPRVHGMALTHDDNLLGKAKQAKEWLAVARDDTGAVVGMMLYRIEGYLGTLQVRHFFYHTLQGRYLLLSWFARHIDQIKEVDVWLPPHEYPETWYADLRVKNNPDVWLNAMGRVLDVAQMGGMTVGSGQFTARITDDVCAWNSGIYTFTSDDGTLQVTTGGEADFTLTIQGLSALVYGTHDPATIVWRGWSDASPAQQAQLAALWPIMPPPYLHENF